MDIFDIIVVILQLIGISIFLFLVYMYFKIGFDTFKKKMLLLFLVLFFIWNLFLLWVFSYIRLYNDIATIYRTGKAQYGCGTFAFHLSNARAGAATAQKSFQQYNIQGKKIIGYCHFPSYPACAIEKDLIENEKVCITYAQSKYKNKFHIYEIKRIDETLAFPK